MRFAIHFDEHQFHQLLEALRSQKLDQILENTRSIMASNQDLLDQVAAAKQAADDNNAAVLAEIARVEAVIAALGTPGLTQAQIDQAVADLSATVTELKGATTAATGERP
jgi:type VI protein secretion system component VasK